MKVFWWQGGLHAEPETREEGAALKTLWQGIRKTSLAEESRLARESDPGVLQKLTEGVVQNSQSLPVSSSSHLVNE